MSYTDFKSKVKSFMGVSTVKIDVNTMMDDLIRRNITPDSLIAVAVSESVRTDDPVEVTLNILIEHLVHLGYYSPDLLDYIMFSEKGYTLDEIYLDIAINKPDVLAPWNYNEISAKTIQTIYKKVIKDLRANPNKYYYVDSDQLYSWVCSINPISERNVFLGILIQIRPSKSGLRYLRTEDVDIFTKAFRDLFDKSVADEPKEVETLLSVIGGVEIRSRKNIEE
jgi:hypothetical protein